VRRKLSKPGGAITLFNNVRVFDGKGTSLSEADQRAGSRQPDRNNFPTPISVDRSATTTIVDGGGRTLMPGLIDNHWHAMLARTTPAQAFGDVGFNNLMLATKRPTL
jgi:imidazolonepropionase-like amidohydrolase